jgi:hypothetical protein
MKSPMVLAGETRRGGSGPFQIFFHGGLVDGKTSCSVEAIIRLPSL